MLVIVGGDIEDWGLIPAFLDANDPRPAKEQIAEKYIGGWNSFKGFKFNKNKITLKYPGDPVYNCISTMLFRDETLHIFPSAWVVIEQKDDTWDVARLD